MTDPTRIGGPAPPPLQSFVDKAREGGTVQVTVDGEGFKVIAQGELRSQQSGARSVAWVQGDVDSTRIFVEALKGSYGTGLSTAVARELGLDPAPGKPLGSRSVIEALEMASTGRQALSGVDFLTRLEHSAGARGPAFESVAKSLGIDGPSLTDEQRARIDSAMQARFDEAVAQGRSPVAPEIAGAWLREELSRPGGTA